MKASMKKMKMPEKSKPEMDLSELGMPESPSDESAESAPMESAESEAGMEKPMSPASEHLKEVSDDDLMAEIKARGLMSQLGEPSESGPDQAPQPDYGM